MSLPPPSSGLTCSLRRRSTAAALLGLVALLQACSAEAQACGAGAQTAWQQLREAALRGDAAAVAGLARFPFQLRGALDSSPHRQLDAAALQKRLPALLAADPGLSPQPSSMTALLQATPQLQARHCPGAGGQVRVGQWVLQSTPQGWRFALAYTDDE